MSYKPLSKREETIAKLIVDAAFAIHKGLGPGLLELNSKRIPRCLSEQSGDPVPASQRG